MLSGSSERKSSIFPSVASFTHRLMFSRSSSCFPVSFTGFAPKSLSDCSRKSSLMGNPARNEPQAHPGASASTSVLPADQAPLPHPCALEAGLFLGSWLPPAPTFLQVYSGSQSDCPWA